MEIRVDFFELIVSPNGHILQVLSSNQPNLTNMYPALTYIIYSIYNCKVWQSQWGGHFCSWIKWIIKVFATYSCLELQNKPWGAIRLFFPEMKIIRIFKCVCCHQKHDQWSEWHCFSYLLPSLPCPPLQPQQQNKHNKKSAWPGFQWLNRQGIIESARENVPKPLYLLPAPCLLGISPNVPVLFW